MYCSNCGHELKQSSSFCPFCGEKLEHIPEKKANTCEKSLNEGRNDSSKRGWLIAVVILVAIIAARIVFGDTEKNTNTDNELVLYDVTEDNTSENIVQPQVQLQEFVADTSIPNDTEDIITEAVKLYTDLLEDEEGLSEQVDAYSQIHYPSAYKVLLDNYAIEDLDGDNIPELILFANMRRIYIIDRQMRISELLAQSIYNVPEKDFFYYEVSAGTGMQIVGMAYNVELRGEELPDGGGVYTPKTLLSGDWNGYRAGDKMALVDGEENSLTGAEFNTRYEQYMDESKSVISYLISDKSGLEKWQKK